MNLPSIVEYVRTTAELGNISAAAEKLGITQSALSSRIKKLEEQLGAAVFTRSKGPLQLTEVGVAYLQTQDEIQEVNLRLERRISDLTNLQCGRVAIGGASFFNTTFLPPVIARFQKAHPAIEVEVVDGTVLDLANATNKGILDLFVTPTRGKNTGLDYVELLTERVFLCVPASSPVLEKLPKPTEEGFARLNADDFALLSDQTFIELDENLQIGSIMKRLYHAHGFTPKHTLRVHQMLTGLSLTLANVGCSLVTESALAANSLQTRPALFLPNESICTRSLFLARKNGTEPSKAATALSEMLIEAAAPWRANASE